MHWFDGMYIGMRWWWVIGSIVVAVIIWLIIRLINKKNSQLSSHKKTALDILNQRYARGEMNEEEYEIKKRELGV